MYVIPCAMKMTLWWNLPKFLQSWKYSEPPWYRLLLCFKCVNRQISLATRGLPLPKNVLHSLNRSSCASCSLNFFNSHLSSCTPSYVALGLPTFAKAVSALCLHPLIAPLNSQLPHDRLHWSLYKYGLKVLAYYVKSPCDLHWLLASKRSSDQVSNQSVGLKRCDLQGFS